MATAGVAMALQTQLPRERVLYAPAALPRLFRLILASCLCSSGCSIKPLSESQTSNPAVKVDLLFEHDGCRVYRFEDNGQRVYFVQHVSVLHYLAILAGPRKRGRR